MRLRSQYSIEYEQKFETVDSLRDYLFSFSEANISKSLNMLMVLCRSDFRKSIKNSPDNYSVFLQNESLPVFTITVQFNNGEKRKEIRALCYESDVPSLFIILSDYKSERFRQLMGRIINYNYPVISKFFLKDTEIRKLFYQIDETYKTLILVYRVLSYSRLSERFNEKELRWTRKSYKEIFEYLLDQNEWIKKINFRIYSEKKDKQWVEKFEGDLSRDCYLKSRGHFQLFYRYVVDYIIKTIGIRLGYLELRSKSAEGRKPEPIVIHFDRDIFKDEGWNKNFVDALSELKNISITELHSNPYLHLNLLDYSDGSSYSVWIVTENEINIIPQVRATVASMSRILNHIYEKINEGETIQYEPIQITSTN